MSRKKKMIVTSVWTLAVLVLISGVVAFLFTAGHSKQVVTEETISRLFGTSLSHEVMKDQRVRMQSILDGFAIGDFSLIERSVGDMIDDMEEVSRTYRPERGKEAAQWRAMAEMLEQAESLKSQTAQGDYARAYTHFNLLVRQCVECHQSQRTWGVFPKAGKESETPEAEEKRGAVEVKTEMVKK